MAERFFMLGLSHVDASRRQVVSAAGTLADAENECTVIFFVL